MPSKIAVFAALSQAGDNKDLVTKLTESYNRLVALTYGGELLDNKPTDAEIAMKEEYEKFRDLIPQFKIDKKTGRLSVSGLDKVAQEKAKKPQRKKR